MDPPAVSVGIIGFSGLAPPHSPYRRLLFDARRGAEGFGGGIAAISGWVSAQMDVLIKTTPGPVAGAGASLTPYPFRLSIEIFAVWI